MKSIIAESSGTDLPGSGTNITSTNLLLTSSGDYENDTPVQLNPKYLYSEV